MANSISDIKCSNIKDIVDTNKLIIQELRENMVKGTKKAGKKNGTENLRRNACVEC